MGRRLQAGQVSQVTYRIPLERVQSGEWFQLTWWNNLQIQYRRVGESSRPRQSHKLEIGGANPSPATKHAECRRLV